MKTGLVLGAGAARGLAHIGVLEVLEENKIQVDCIAGASIGSLVGAYYATHGEIAGCKKMAESLTRTDIMRLIDFYPAKGALLRGEKLRLWIDKLLEGKSFSDTKIPIKIVATDLLTGEQVIFSEGKLSDAVRASISIPGIFLPYELNGRTLVDGGLVNSTPIDIAREMGAERIIAVDLPLTKLKKAPNIFGTLLQSYEIMREATIKRTKDMTIITPDFPDRITGHLFLNKGFIGLGRKAAEKVYCKVEAPPIQQ
jgi:NTE family protein